MIERTLHSTALAACSTLTLTLAAAIALAQSPAGAPGQQPSATIAPEPASAPPPPPTPAMSPAPPAPAMSPAPPAPPAPPVVLPVPQPAAFIPPAPVPQRREHGNLIFDSIPPPDPALATRLARYQQSRGATFLDWLADGSLLVSTRFGDTEQVHRVSAPLATSAIYR